MSYASWRKHSRAIISFCGFDENQRLLIHRINEIGFHGGLLFFSNLLFWKVLRISPLFYFVSLISPVSPPLFRPSTYITRPPIQGVQNPSNIREKKSVEFTTDIPLLNRQIFFVIKDFPNIYRYPPPFSRSKIPTWGGYLQ